MTVWNLDHKHRANGPTIPEQIENGLALGCWVACLLVALIAFALAGEWI